MKYFVFFLLLNLFEMSWSQDDARLFSIRGRVVDLSTDEQLPFVSLFKIRDKRGTLTDFNGEFILEKVHQYDTLLFRFTGYEEYLFVADSVHSGQTIYLTPEFQEIEEVVILADNSILYDLVAGTKKMQRHKPEVAKTYFELESYQGDQQLELFQGYYNGSYQGYNVTDLQMKNARFALSPLSKRIFASTESSKALYMHDMMRPNAYFPSSPFEFNKRKLRNKYQLLLSAKYSDAAGRTIYVIRFKPRKNAHDYFHGKVWIDSLSNSILKTDLSITQTNIHPFRSIWSLDTLKTVNLSLSKTFERAENSIRIQHVNFNYDLIYQSHQDTSFKLATQAVLHPYDYSSSFVLPFFDFPSASNEDYRRIQMLPDNTLFWNCMDEFKLENNAAKNKFIHETATITPQNLFYTDTLFKQNFFEHPYAVWNGNRIILRGLSADSANYYDEKGMLNADRYRIKVQLFVDINDACDSTVITTKTIFDPYVSFYHFEATKETQVFLNIYYDLVEIERRKLKKELKEVVHNTEAIYATYARAEEKVSKLSAKYFKEVQRGTERKALKKWNEYIRQEIGIDNFALFDLEVEEE